LLSEGNVKRYKKRRHTRIKKRRGQKKNPSIGRSIEILGWEDVGNRSGFIKCKLTVVIRN
jgi:hypothetical protein